MKVDLSAAMEALHSLEWIKPGYSEVRVSLHRDDDGTERITWDIYAYRNGGDIVKDNAWVMGHASFDEAVKELKKVLQEEYTLDNPKQKFIE